jgi:WD40 repeat protein
LKVAVPVPGDARLRLSPHARWLAVLADGSAAVWRLSRPPASFPITGHMEEVWDVAFSPDGTCLASVGEGGYACIQRLGEKNHFRRFRTGLLSAVALAYSPDGSRLVTANSDSSLRVWETGAYQQVLSIIPSVFRVARRLWFVDSNTLLELGILDYNPNKPFFRKYYAPPLLTGQTPNSIRQ